MKIKEICSTIQHFKIRFENDLFFAENVILACPWEEVRCRGHFSWEGTIK